jgi:hypothetical protein
MTDTKNPDIQGPTGRMPDGTFPPGVSGNPAGRPKRKTLTELIHAKLDENPDTWQDIATLVIRKILEDKNDKVLTTFWEYTDGKPKQTIDLNDASEEIRKAKEYVDNKIRSMGGDISQEQVGGEISNDGGAKEDI